VASIVVATCATGDAVRAQSAGTPFAVLLPAQSVAFPNDTDSNSPAIWEIVDSQWTLSVLNSVAGGAKVSEGRSVQRLTGQATVRFSTAAPQGGYWFESVIRDADSWYGFYHNEREGVVCAGSNKVWPRIGAARSDDRGRTWADLGPIIETPADTTTCTTRNHYFVGGVGDFSVVLDPDRAYAYFYYSQYVEADGAMGVSVARMAWADRDAPEGRVDIWNGGAWLPPSLQAAEDLPADIPEDEDPPPPDPDAWAYPLATPIFPAADRWDNGNATVDVFWGPSIHWNTQIDSYVMLLNKAASNEWGQGGVYVSYNRRIDDPNGWTAPAILFKGGRWYPQVIGLGEGQGTDTYAGAVARFFMGGRSDFTITFGRR
jgi:hypothetical protein